VGAAQPGGQLRAELGRDRRQPLVEGVDAAVVVIAEAMAAGRWLERQQRGAAVGADIGLHFQPVHVAQRGDNRAGFGRTRSGAQQIVVGVARQAAVDAVRVPWVGRALVAGVGVVAGARGRRAGGVAQRGGQGGGLVRGAGRCVRARAALGAGPVAVAGGQAGRDGGGQEQLFHSAP
jgi:hypothetical protein